MFDRMTAIDIVKRYRPDSPIIMRGSWLRHSCIIDTVHPHHSHGDRNPSAGLNVENGIYSCFAYSDHAISFNHLKSIMNFTCDFEPEPKSLPTDFKHAIESKLETVRRTIDLRPYKRDISQYMLDRGFLKSTIEAADLRVDPESGRVVIPVYEDGICVAYQKRSVDGSEPKYKNNIGFDKQEHLYHISELDQNKPLFVFESVMSVMRAYDYGITNAVSTFGSHMSDIQANEIRKFRDVCLWYDGDRSGVLGARQAIRKLYQTNLKVVDASDLGSRDIADISPREAISKIATAKNALEFVYGDDLRKSS